MDTKFIDLANVTAISRGDNERFLLYLTQFNDLIPDRLNLLNQALKSNNREQIRQILHKMIPQLQFFGIQNVTTPIYRLELEYNTMPTIELDKLVKDIIAVLEQALYEVEQVIKGLNE